MMDGIKAPDLVIYLRPRDVASIMQRSEFGQERYDSALTQHQVIQNFDHIYSVSDPKRSVLIINSEESIQGITGKIVEKIKECNIF